MPLTLDDLIFLKRELPLRETDVRDILDDRVDTIESFDDIEDMDVVIANDRFFSRLEEVFELAEAEIRRREGSKP